MYSFLIRAYLDVYFFFFFQAEDGIRDIGVTGVQTCALPISLAPAGPSALLLVVGHPGRQRHHVPVGVGVALVRAVAVDVHPLGTGLLAYRFGNPVDELLEVFVLLHSELAGHLLAVLLGGDQGVAVGPGVSVEEGDGPVVLVDDVLGELNLPLHHRADEAGLRPEALVHGFHVRVVAFETFVHSFLLTAGTIPAYTGY